MKGLLLKDIYIIKESFKIFLLVAIAYIVLFVASEKYWMYFFIFCSSIPAMLLCIDERSHWVRYSAALPYTKGQIVSVKYLIGFAVQIAMLAVATFVSFMRVKYGGAYPSEDLITAILVALTGSTIITSVSLTVLFKYGYEGGRAAKALMFCATCIGFYPVIKLIATDMKKHRILLTFLINIGIYALSWCLSIVFFKKRDLQ